jgi:hypothetical protein
MGAAGAVAPGGSGISKATYGTGGESGQGGTAVDTLGGAGLMGHQEAGCGGQTGGGSGYPVIAANCCCASSSSSMSATARFSSKCCTDEVPGISKTLGASPNVQASAT